MKVQFKEIFLKRCAQMLALYATSLGVLEKLREVFRFWSMPLEDARAQALQEFVEEKEALFAECVVHVEDDPGVAACCLDARHGETVGQQQVVGCIGIGVHC